jgi:type II secretory pathway pseudopilin PulG
MDDSFSFRASLPLRRQFDPLVVKATVFGMLVVLGIGLFASWVIRSERESFSRADRRVTASRAEAAETVGAPEAATIDREADEATRIALDAARAAFLEHRSFLDAGPAQLSALQPGYTFVDGPSTASRIVSVAATTDTWAATVRGSGGTCHWIRATSAGGVTRGTGLECTGTAALGPSAPR